MISSGERYETSDPVRTLVKGRTNGKSEIDKLRDFDEIVFHYKSATRNYAVSSGRMSRRAFWYFYGAIAIISAVSLSIDPLLETDIFFPLTVLVHIVPHFSALVRRLHDVGYATWVVIPCVVPPIAFVFAAMASEEGPNEYGPQPAPYSSEASQTPTLRRRRLMKGNEKPALANHRSGSWNGWPNCETRAS
ncbi:DUF805 domain-containing protein [Mesorhizobium sp. B2-4-13]|nr:DUF805 domain-containing protein [Mesorhizobium sp. B2-4-13]